jgi:hypothetical protein
MSAYEPPLMSYPQEVSERPGDLSRERLAELDKEARVFRCTLKQGELRKLIAMARRSVREAPNVDAVCAVCKGGRGDGGNYMGRWEFECTACDGTGRTRAGGT